MRRYSAFGIGLRALVLLHLLFTLSNAQGNENNLSVGTWGGPYEVAQESALFSPFTQRFGIGITTEPYFGGLDSMRSAQPPDIADMLEEDSQLACEEGLLMRLPKNLLKEARTDLIDGAITDCGIAHLTFSTVVAFDERAFPAAKPQRIADFFDIKQFPGKRALQKNPAAIFEWAMLAEGVPATQVYDLLSTERGLRLVLRRLDTIKDHIIWWEKPGEAVNLLEQGKVVMASGYNGRFFESRLRQFPITMMWDGQIIDRSVWSISSKLANNPQQALDFIQFVMQPKRQARIAEFIPYGPTRLSAFNFIGLHPSKGISMTNHLPTAPHHLGNALFRDTEWYARTSKLRHRYFESWLATQ